MELYKRYKSINIIHYLSNKIIKEECLENYSKNIYNVIPIEEVVNLTDKLYERKDLIEEFNVFRCINLMSILEIIFRTIFESEIIKVYILTSIFKKVTIKDLFKIDCIINNIAEYPYYFGNNNKLKNNKTIYKDIIDSYIYKKYTDDCSVCLEPFKQNEKVATLKCNHIFHYKCIIECMKSRYSGCPLCRGHVDSSSLNLRYNLFRIFN